jgi:hypothetical protein
MLLAELKICEENIPQEPQEIEPPVSAFLLALKINSQVEPYVAVEPTRTNRFGLRSKDKLNSSALNEFEKLFSTHEEP